MKFLSVAILAFAGLVVASPLPVPSLQLKRGGYDAQWKREPYNAQWKRDPQGVRDPQR
ncbi:hypothetical protein EUX98_g4454 [Antrodiella citrinella]|uniref:Uncharacterized protein n=1 Tax=Antrodiella citrinella TaxID=2447956 RepID=A0A4S4N1X3_9APHY|nr:hypothetical protein EUX98_g4454 [Antrodiella citrinella]